MPADTDRMTSVTLSNEVLAAAAVFHTAVADILERQMREVVDRRRRGAPRSVGKPLDSQPFWFRVEPN